MSKQIKVELQSFMGNDREIANSAWTSSTLLENKTTKTDEQVTDLVKRLAKDGHSTPFESVVLRFWIKMPIQTDRQFMSHRIQSTSGMSGRYRTMPSDFLQVPEDINDIVFKSFNTNETLLTTRQRQVLKEYNNICENANYWYKETLKHLKEAEKENKISNNEYKRAREFFRGVLPQNNMTERISIMNLRAFANFIRLRLSPHAQPEIQEVAKQMLQAVKDANIAPEAIKALESINWRI